MQEIVFHSNCPDGIISREIAKLVHPDAICVPFNYENDFEIRPNQLWVDGSPKTYDAKRSVLTQGGKILDHHITAIEELKQLGQEFPHSIIIGNNDAPIPESGAWLTYTYAQTHGSFNLKSMLREDYLQLALTIAVGDTFRKDRPEWSLARALADYIMVFGNEFFYDGNWPALEVLAEQMKIVVRKKAEELTKRAITIDDFAFLNHMNISNAADILMNEDIYNVVVGYQILGSKDKNIIRYTVRSRRDFDRAEDALIIAKNCGGGGHLNAHGFEVPFTGQNPIQQYFDLWSK